MSTKGVSLTRHLLDHEASEGELGVAFCHIMPHWGAKGSI
jgi:hypothetical protein